MEFISRHRHSLWYCKFMCCIFSKATQPFDFIKPNIIQNLAYKVNISQINVGSIWNFRIRFFQNSWLDCEQYEKNQWKEPMQEKGTQSTASVQSVMLTFILFKCHSSIDNSTDFYLFTLLWKGSLLYFLFNMKRQGVLKTPKVSFK